MTPFLATLPDVSWLLVVAVILFVLVLIGGSWFLREFREVRSNLADELRREIQSAKEPSPVSVQQPLVVSEHQELVTRREHEAFVKKMDDELGRERAQRKKQYEKTEEMGNRLTRVEEKTDAQTRQLGTMDHKMDQVLMRLPRAS